MVYGSPGYGWLDANDPGYDAGYDSGYDSGDPSGNGDNGPYDAGPYPEGPGVAGGEYGEPGPEGPEPAYGAEQPPVPYTADATAGRGDAPAVAQPPAAVKTSPDAELSIDGDAVTLVFKDGRPVEKIHNYALTRTTLYVTDARPREIPVAALDLAATQKANREAGVRFQLPVTQ